MRLFPLLRIRLSSSFVLYFVLKFPSSYPARAFSHANNFFDLHRKMMSHPDRATISHNENDLIHKSQRLLDSGEIEDPIEALRYLCLARGFSGFLGFGRIFRNMDQSGKRVLNLKQFTHAMEQTGFEFAHDGVCCAKY